MAKKRLSCQNTGSSPSPFPARRVPHESSDSSPVVAAAAGRYGLVPACPLRLAAGGPAPGTPLRPRTPADHHHLAARRSPPRRLRRLLLLPGLLGAPRGSARRAAVPTPAATAARRGDAHPGARRHPHQALRAPCPRRGRASPPVAGPRRCPIPVRPCLGHPVGDRPPSALGTDRLAHPGAAVRAAQGSAQAAAAVGLGLSHQAATGRRVAPLGRTIEPLAAAPAGRRGRWRLRQEAVLAGGHGGRGDGDQPAAPRCGLAPFAGATAGGTAGPTRCVWPPGDPP